MIRWLAFAAALLSQPAWATTDAWPSLQDVINVEAGDVLNVRSGPGTEFEVIGTLGHDTESIEVIRPDDDFEWALINIDERTGWVSMDYIVPQPGQWDSLPPNVRRCFGTEPFWSIRLDGDQIGFSAPERTTDGTVAERWSSANRLDTHALSLRLDDDPDAEVTAILSRRTCSDGMSDREYGISIDVLIRGSADQALVSGCCSIQPPAE